MLHKSGIRKLSLTVISAPFYRVTGYTLQNKFKSLFDTASVYPETLNPTIPKCHL